MPKAHTQHLETCAAKLRAEGIDPLDAVEAIESGQRADSPALAGLAQIVGALGAQPTRDALRALDGR